MDPEDSNTPVDRLSRTGQQLFLVGLFAFVLYLALALIAIIYRAL
jgi:hypothetical protein